MVIINTQQHVYEDLKFRYFLEVPRCDVIFGSARETTGKAHLFLIFKSEDKIYKRNGRNQTWQPVHSISENSQIRSVLASAISDSSIPRYTTDKFNLN